MRLRAACCATCSALPRVVRRTRFSALLIPLLAYVVTGSRFVSYNIVQQLTRPRDEFLVSDKTEVDGVGPDDPQARGLGEDTDFATPALFRAIMPTDVVQGATGDCWVAASIASMARFPHAVRRLFREQTLSVDGIYHLQLYDPGENEWVNVTVDDKVPSYISQGTKRAVNMRTSDLYEVWPMMLEKAFAKVMSSFRSGRSGYQGLTTGVPSWALAALSGSSKQWRYTSKEVNGSFQWTKNIMNVSAGNLVVGTDRGKILSSKFLEKVDADGLWTVLVDAMTKNWLMTSAVEDARGSVVSVSAGPGGHFERERGDGLYLRHSYSILAVEQLSRGLHQVCVKNVTVTYTPADTEELATELRLDEHNFYRGWAPGDWVWAHTDMRSLRRSNSPSRLLVKRILERRDCQGETCVELSRGLANESQASDLQTVPISWVLGRHNWGLAEVHGVRPGWKLTSHSADWQTLTFEGVVDRSVCEETRQREAQYRHQNISTLAAGEKLRLVKVRNPWGTSMDYTGKWSNDDLASWTAHPDIEEALGFHPVPDGTFWIDFDDFARKFSSVSISPIDMATFAPPSLAS
eukprot:gnl/TRDRNA2_/TRDRNA2_43013_c0_seq1.p1 gnl/TRDRNA2_/TRDRNA2_43013_c0~~gnl/TRDRNA2_/TRDRNA2_43013_c0_seq1.p1  ORF type:complete len:577 (-),score=66.97 gnl/TRDRNA2_/TRDRNA2_43013_c0_seq1:110-1840(-)